MSVVWRWRGLGAIVPSRRIFQMFFPGKVRGGSLLRPNSCSCWFLGRDTILRINHRELTVLAMFIPLDELIIILNCHDAIDIRYCESLYDIIRVHLILEGRHGSKEKAKE